MKMDRSYIISAALGAVVNILLNMIFIPRYGYIAAAYTTLVCYIIFMVMHYVFSRKVLIEQDIKDAVYDNRSVFLLSAIILIICLISMVTFNYMPVRIVLIVVIIAVCVLKRNTIKGIITSFKQ